MASSFLRSAAGRVLGRSMPQGSFPRSPVRFFSDGVGRMESKHSSLKYDISPGGGAFEEFGDKLRKLFAEADKVLEREKGFERQEQRQKVLSFFIFPTLAALWIFGPEKKKQDCQKPITSLGERAVV